MHRPSLAIATIAAALAAAAAQAAAAVVVTDLALGSVVDPVGGEDVNVQVAGGSLAVVNGTPDLAVIQDWTGFQSVGSNADGVTVVSFTDPARPDLRFTWGGAPNPATGANTAPGTSAGTALNLQTGQNLNLVTLTVDFGTYADGAFTAGTVGADVVGFTLSNLRGSIKYRVDYFGLAPAALATQEYVSNLNNADGSGNHGEAFFRYDGDGTPAAAVTRVVILRDPNNSTTAANGANGFDDFAFAGVQPIPEPSVATAVVGAAGLLAGRRRR